MKALRKFLLKNKSIQSINIDNKVTSSFPVIKIVVSKSRLKERELEDIYDILYSQIDFEWQVDLIE